VYLETVNMAQTKYCVVCGAASNRETWENSVDGFVACDGHSPAQVRASVDKFKAMTQHAKEGVEDGAAKAQARIQQVQNASAAAKAATQPVVVPVKPSETPAKYPDPIK
jgi:hypothetical protein